MVNLSQTMETRMTNEQKMQAVANSLSVQLNMYVNMVVDRDVELAQVREQVAAQQERIKALEKEVADAANRTAV